MVSHPKTTRDGPLREGLQFEATPQKREPAFRPVRTLDGSSNFVSAAVLWSWRRLPFLLPFRSKTWLMLSAVLLVGCARIAPFPVCDSGFVQDQTYLQGRPFQWNLSPSQVRDLSQWFSRHRSGWRLTFVDVGPRVFVYLKLGDRNVGAVNIYPEELFFEGSCRPISKAERNELSQIIGEEAHHVLLIGGAPDS